MTTADEVRAALVASVQAAGDAVAAAQAALDAFDAMDGPSGPVAPTVVLVAVPAQVQQGQAVTATAMVTVDPSEAVDAVDFLVDGTVVATDTQAPFSWTSTQLAVGTRVIVARVMDTAGQSATSEPVQVVVTAVPPPVGAVISLTSPPAGQLVSQPFMFAAAVTEAQGRPTRTVEYLADDVLAADQDVPPPPYTKPSKGTLVPGAHRLQARHTDTSGTVTLSPVVNVTVPTPVPPTPGKLGKVLVLPQAGSTPSQLGANGKRLIVIGTNDYGVVAYNSNGQMSAVNGWEQAQATANAQTLAGLGVNWRRIPVANRSDATQVANLRKLVDANEAAGIYSMLVAFESGNAPNAAAGQLLVNLWKQLGSRDSVVLNTINEPHLISAGQWVSGSIAEIQAIRAGGYGGLVVADCQNWAWTLDPASARQVLAADPAKQVAFASHRYAFDGSSIRGSGDAASWSAEWSQAPDLAKIVGEYGWFNGGGNSSSIATWCKPMADAIVAATRAGWLSGGLSWMFLWDQNSHIDATAPPPGEPSSSNRDWYAISRGAPWTWNAWGSVARGMWQQLSAMQAA